MHTNTVQLESDLNQFTGTEAWYRHPLNPNVAYTDGMKYFADNAGDGAYWLLDILATQPEILNQMTDGGFVMIELEVGDNEAVLRCTDGNDGLVYNRAIDYTDCPEGVWQFYFTDNVILLPSEY